LQAFVKPFGMDRSIHTGLPQHTLYPERFLEILATLFVCKTFYKLESKPHEVMLYMKHDRQKGD